MPTRTFASVVVMALFALPIGCVAEHSNEEQSDTTGESQDHLLAGRRVSETELARLVRAAGFPEDLVGTMVCTAKYESSFYERATHRNSNGTTDRGLFQINSVNLGSQGCPASAAAVFDAATNARCAYGIYRSQGLGAWYGYKRHRAECDSYTVSGAGGGDEAASSDYGNDVAPDPGPGGCWSGTLEEMVEANACVESKYDGGWMQCHDGLWYSGVAGYTGPYGACSSTHPLQ